MIRVVHAGPSISLGSFKMYVLVYVSLPGIGDVLSRTPNASFFFLQTALTLDGLVRLLSIEFCVLKKKLSTTRWVSNSHNLP